MTFDEYARFDGIGLAELVAAGQISAAELLDAAIARCDETGAALNAVIYRNDDEARRIADAPLPDGPFKGVPFLLKDISLQAAGTPTRQGSRFWPSFPAGHDSFLMTRFRNSGLVAFGKTNVPEFGLVPTTEGKLYGPAHNPWNLGLSTGGSSGGAAAAVAAGIVPLAHANDGGGSIRIPASACGLVGLKPTRGRVSSGPDLPAGVDGFSIDFVVSRSVRDSAAALDVASGNEPGDPYSAPPAPASYREAALADPKPLRIAFATKRLDGTDVAHDCAQAIEHAVRLCRSLGHSVEEASPQFDLDLFLPAFTNIWCSNLAAAVDFLAAITGQIPGPDTLEGLTFGYYETGKRVSGSDYVRSKIALNQASRAVARFHQSNDLWLTPTLGEPPWTLGHFDPDRRDIEAAMTEFAAYVPFTPVQNVTGQPAINLPLYWNDANIPVGVQFVAGFGDELTLLQLATQLERAAPWAERYKTIAI